MDMIKDKEQEGPKLEKHRDGTVWKRMVCSCGSSVYKKNLTTGTIEFMARDNGTRNIRLIPISNVTQAEIECQACGNKHLELGIVEGLSIA